MDVAEKLIRAKNDFDDVYEAGKQAEYDRFMDMIQRGGARSDYRYAFSYWRCGKDGLPLKYPIKPKGASNGTFVFFACNGGLSEEDVFDFSKIAHLVDFSEATSGAHSFQSCGFDNITADFSSATTLTSAFAADWFAMPLTTLRLKVNENCTFSNTFYLCRNLKHMTFLYGSVIGKSINYQHSPLTRESFINVVNTLSSTATGQTATFNKAAKEAAFTAEEWATLIATKSNWTFSLV